jgi:hypothetical protein
MEIPMAATKPAATARAARPTVSGKPARAWSKTFLAALSDTSNVAAAARRAGVSTSAVYERRRTDVEFSRQWQLALCEGYDNLEMELLHRLRNGELKPVTGAKRSVRSFDNGIAFRLLLAHKESATRTRAMRENVSAAQVRAAIDRKVAEIRERVLARRAAEVAALPAPAEPGSKVVAHGG